MHDKQDDQFQQKLQIFRDTCEKAGIKMTHQRLEIFYELGRAKDHPSAEEIHKRLRAKMPTISLDTVYRTLATFERHGLINRVQILDDKARYESNSTPHHHLVCVECKSIQDLYCSAFDVLDIPPEANEWGEVQSKHVELRGLCKECLKRKQEQKA